MEGLKEPLHISTKFSKSCYPIIHSSVMRVHVWLESIVA